MAASEIPPPQLYFRDIRHGNVAVPGGDCAGRMTYWKGRDRGVAWRVGIVGKAIAECNSETVLRGN
jgi:hypothetical protein